MEALSREGAPAVSTAGLTRRFNELVAVDHLDLEIGSGAFFGLLGSNGVGKTTLIRMLTTLLPPSAGTARVAGFDVIREPREVRRRIGYVPQMVSADSGLTGRENLTLSARLLVDAIRALMIEGGQSTFGFGTDITVQLFTLVALVAITAKLYPSVAR